MDFPLVGLVLIISVSVIVILRDYFKSKERRTLIEKGLDPSLVNIYSDKSSRKFFLYCGIILLGVALGMITGITLAIIFTSRQNAEDFLLISVLVTTGISLLVCYYLSGNKSN